MRLLLAGLLLSLVAGNAAAYSNYNVVFVTSFSADPNPFFPYTASTRLSSTTFEYAEWYFLGPSTFAEPVVTYGVAGQTLIGQLSGGRVYPPNLSGFPPLFYWFNQIGERDHLVDWDGRGADGQIVEEGLHLATVSVYAGDAFAFSWTIVATESAPGIDLVLGNPAVSPGETTHLTVRVTDPWGVPIPNFALVLEATAPEYVAGQSCAGCGGHDHGGERPVGVFVDGAGNPADMHFEGATGPAGEPLELDFRSSQFGGEVNLVARSALTPSLADNEQLAVRVDGLQLLATDSGNYIKIGGTSLHHGPPGWAAEDHNHFGTPGTIQAVADIATAYRQAFNERLRINDMSLPDGGGFDIYGNWDADVTSPSCRQAGHGHCSHRTGRNVDVSSMTSEGTLVDMWWLEDMVTQGLYHGGFIDEGSHYHLTF